MTDYTEAEKEAALALVGEAGLTMADTDDDSLIIPAGLSPNAAGVYAEVASRYTLRPDEWQYLEAACRSLTVAESLEAAYAREPEPMVRASHGGMQVNPLLVQAERSRAQMAQHLARLRLPDETGVSPFSHTARGRKGGNTRWSREAERQGKVQRSSTGEA